MTIALTVELVLLTVFAGCWWMLGADPPDEAFVPLRALTAAALGLQQRDPAVLVEWSPVTARYPVGRADAGGGRCELR